MKDPSIHIKKSDFKKILKSLEIKDFPLDQFLQAATKKAVNARTVLVTNDRVNKRMEHILLANKGDASMVADLVYSIRIKLGHRGIRKVNQTNPREWDFCKKLADACNHFCEEFQFNNPREGFLVYIETGLKKITSNRNIIEKLVSMYDYIMEAYGSEMEIKNDPTPDDTRLIHNYYVSSIASNTGIMESYVDQPVKYIHFLKLKNFLETRGWDYENFIDAQFEALSYCNGIPPLESLYGDKAIERYNKWLYKNHSQNEPVKVRGSLWDAIKNK